jgi:hypothetical protein
MLDHGAVLAAGNQIAIMRGRSTACATVDVRPRLLPTACHLLAEAGVRWAVMFTFLLIFAASAHAGARKDFSGNPAL